MTTAASTTPSDLTPQDGRVLVGMLNRRLPLPPFGIGRIAQEGDPDAHEPTAIALGIAIAAKLCRLGYLTQVDYVEKGPRYALTDAGREKAAES